MKGDSGKTVLEDTSEEIYSDGEYADYSYFNGNNNEFLASYVDDTYNDYDTPPRGDPVSHFATQLPPSVVRSLTQIGNIKSVAFDNRSAILLTFNLSFNASPTICYFFSAHDSSI